MSLIRSIVRATLGHFARIPAASEWVHFLFYHGVPNGQRRAFCRQLTFLRQHGEFMGLDEALTALQSPGGIGGRYFCLTFDDGFRSAFTNVTPILQDMGIPAAFFIPTKYIGLDLDRDWHEIKPFYERCRDHQGARFEFLSWQECRQIADAGFTIGSHTHSHQRLTALRPDAVRDELRLSRQLIEGQLLRPCRHFCCPWGRAHRDFDPELHPAMARDLGYESFLTAEEGPSLRGDSAFYVRRTGCEPEYSPAVVRYSLFSPLAARGRGCEPGRRKATPASPGQNGTAQGHRGPRLEVREAELVRLAKFPYPFQAGFTVASDIDSANLERFRAVHALFCAGDVIRPGTPEWRTLALGADSASFVPEVGGVRGLELDLADSFFLVGDATTFGMYRYLPDQGQFQPDYQEGQNCSEVIRRYFREGRIDTFHAFLHHTRSQVRPLLAEFYGWCEQEEVRKPSVWINHSLPVTPTGLCPSRLHPGTAKRLVRLAGRNLVGKWLGREHQPLRFAFARYQGDTPRSPHYINDLLAANGLRYVWLNADNDLHRNRIALPEHSMNGRDTILRSVTMDDGVRYYRFDRCYGKPPGRLGGGAYLRDSENGFDASTLINESNLEMLCRAGGTCILYTHWTHPRSFPISDEAISRFQLLRRWRDSGRIWITSTGRLLEWTRRRTFLQINCSRDGRRLTVEINGVQDPVFGWEKVSLADLDGLCLRLPDAQVEVSLAIGSRLLLPDQMHRRDDLCWLDASPSVM